MLVYTTDVLVGLENKKYRSGVVCKGITITCFLVTSGLVNMHVTQHKNIGLSANNKLECARKWSSLMVLFQHVGRTEGK